MQEFLAERPHLLAEGNRLTALYKSSGGTEAGEKAIYAAFDLHDRYVELLPEVVVSRCPFTGEVVSWPIDVVGLDGWFWNVGNPLRRLVDPVLPTWLAMGGAVHLTEPVAPAPFPRDPGPDRPYVIPRILEQPETRAVINQTRIGPHIGWNTTYFTTHRFHHVPLENLWGGNQYELYDADGHWRAWGEHTQVASDYDFDLRPWIESGKLLWIAPDDPVTKLRTSVADCPYLDIPGTEIVQDLPVVPLW